MGRRNEQEDTPEEKAAMQAALLKAEQHLGRELTTEESLTVAVQALNEIGRRHHGKAAKN